MNINIIPISVISLILISFVPNLNSNDFIASGHSSGSHSHSSHSTHRSSTTTHHVNKPSTKIHRNVQMPRHTVTSQPVHPPMLIPQPMAPWEPEQPEFPIPPTIIHHYLPQVDIVHHAPPVIEDVPVTSVPPPPPFIPKTQTITFANESSTTILQGSENNNPFSTVTVVVGPQDKPPEPSLCLGGHWQWYQGDPNAKPLVSGSIAVTEPYWVCVTDPGTDSQPGKPISTPGKPDGGITLIGSPDDFPPFVFTTPPKVTTARDSKGNLINIIYGPQNLDPNPGLCPHGGWQWVDPSYSDSSNKSPPYWKCLELTPNSPPFSLPDDHNPLDAGPDTNITPATDKPTLNNDKPPPPPTPAAPPPSSPASPKAPTTPTTPPPSTPTTPATPTSPTTPARPTTPSTPPTTPTTPTTPPTTTPTQPPRTTQPPSTTTVRTSTVVIVSPLGRSVNMQIPATLIGTGSIIQQKDNEGNFFYIALSDADHEPETNPCGGMWIWIEPTESSIGYWLCFPLESKE